mmetsp:Transcript_12829/g.27964  ORF Transcript_12829/g.27964 Transcript_12829/m.27964 type:complete len:220 (-) Transcript_12829:320-979(-)
MEPAFAASAGIITVLPSFASLPNASTYCSATRRATASAPCRFAMASATSRSASAVASALSRIASACPFAVLICCCCCASDDRIVAAFCPSAMLISLCCSPSESRIFARFLRSASAWSSIAFRTFAGGLISRISYRRHVIPHAFAASLIACTILVLSVSRSSNVLSSVSLPSSDRIVVCARSVSARYGFSTPYDAAFGSSTFAYSTPSMLIVTLSRVIAI